MTAGKPFKPGENELPRRTTGEETAEFRRYWEAHGAVFLEDLSLGQAADLADLIFRERPEIIASISAKLKQWAEHPLTDEEKEQDDDDISLIRDFSEIEIYCNSIDEGLRRYSKGALFDVVVERIRAMGTKP